MTRLEAQDIIQRFERTVASVRAKRWDGNEMIAENGDIILELMKLGETLVEQLDAGTIDYDARLLGEYSEKTLASRSLQDLPPMIRFIYPQTWYREKVLRNIQNMKSDGWKIVIPIPAAAVGDVPIDAPMIKNWRRWHEFARTMPIF